MTWLVNVAGVPVERISGVKRSFTTANMSAPPKAVMHTTEGGWDGSLNVFKTSTGTPTFMIGRDGTKLRVAQFMPIGEMALTLKNPSGGVETNRVCRVQIELVGFSKKELWLPDEKTTEALADLMGQIKDKAQVPLRRGGDGTRNVSRWLNASGWFGHVEVPENDHVDPGNLNYTKLFALAGQEEIDLIDSDRLDALEKAAIRQVETGIGPGTLPEQERLIFWSLAQNYNRGKEASGASACADKLAQIKAIVS